MSGECDKPRYGCADYREEMRLNGLMRLLERRDLTDDERRAAETEVRAIEAKLGMG